MVGIVIKFTIRDDLSGLIIGHCKDILGLDGEIHTSEEMKFHELQLKEFIFTTEFKSYLSKNKESISRLIYISITKPNDESIGEIPFFIFDNIYYHHSGFLNETDNIVWTGSLERIVSPEERYIWNRWIEAVPTQRNEWADLSEKQRRAWLQVVRNYGANQRNYQRKGSNFILEGKDIIDYSSFFCALGEAIHGPGGYYGFDINSMIDCFHGDYGAEAPFTLIWKDHQIAREALDQYAWLKEIKAKQIEDRKLLTESVFEEVGDRPLFDALLETAKSYNVNVWLQ